MGRSRGLVPVLTIAVLVIGLSGSAEAITWSGASGTDLDWSTGANWVGGSPPTSGQDAVFDHTTDGGSAGALTNVADTGFTINKLNYTLASGAETSFFQTTHIAAGTTLLATGGLYVAPDDFAMTANKTVDVTITGDAGSLLQVGNSGTYTAKIIIANNPDDPSGPTLTGNLDLSGLPAFKAYLNTFDIANSRRHTRSTVTLAETNTVTANTLTLASHSGSSGGGTRTLNLGQTNTLNINTIYVGRRKTHALMQFDPSLTGPALTLRGRSGGSDRVDYLRIAYNDTGTSGRPTATLDLTRGTVDARIGSMIVGYKSSGNTGDGYGFFKMAAGTFDATTIVLGKTGSGTSTSNEGEGTFELQGGTVKVGSLLLGQKSGSGKPAGTVEQTGGTFTVTGACRDAGGASTLNLHGGTFTAVLGLDVDTVDLGTTGSAATLSLVGKSSQAAWQIGDLAHGADGTLELRPKGLITGPVVVGNTADFANGAELAIDETVVAGSSASTADQTVWIGGTGSWDNTTHTDWTNGLPAGFTIHTSDTLKAVQAATLTDAGLALDAGSAAGWSLSVDTGAGEASITRTGGQIVSGPVLALINDGASIVTRDTDLAVAEQAGSDAARVQITNGSLTVGSPAQNRDLTLAGAASPGQLLQQGGTVTAHGNVLDGGGTSTLHVDGGTMNVTGDLKVDNLRVGYEAKTGSLSAAGVVEIGASGNLDLGRKTIKSDTNTLGTLDLSGATSFTADLDNLRLGTVTISGGVGQAHGRLTLAPTNVIDATTITIADSPHVGLSGDTSSITLGHMNTITANTLNVGRSKGKALVAFGAGGGTLDLGTQSHPVNATIGHQPSYTGGGSNGTMDLSNGTFNAWMSTLTIGKKAAAAKGTTNGTMIFEDGSVNASSIVLADHYANSGSASSKTNGTLTMSGGSLTAGSMTLTNTHGTTYGTATATVNFSGGTISAGSIAKGAGSAAFHWTGGTLHADNFGFDLLNTDDGTLAPGHSVGTTNITGSYTQGEDATLEIEIDGPLYDLVNVIKAATLDGFLGVKGDPVIGMTYDVLVADQGINDLGMEIISELPLYLFYEIVPKGGEAEAVRLKYTPEPGTLTLLALGGLGLMVRRRRRK